MTERHDSTGIENKASESEVNGRVTLNAQFWRSPFAVAAALALTCQAMLMVYAMLSGKALDYSISISMIIVAAMMLVAGVWPSWNYLQITSDGLEQHAGLTRLHTNWKKIQNVRVFPSWVEIRHIDGDTPGGKKVRTVRLLNRYGISSEEFGDLIEERWRSARGLEI